uniref:Uncharacterized protein n=1 Tax=Haemonchus placei TaxID=6290 RepID=A0A0N4WTU1_HAEPC
MYRLAFNLARKADIASSSGSLCFLADFSATSAAFFLSAASSIRSGDFSGSGTACGNLLSLAGFLRDTFESSSLSPRLDARPSVGNTPLASVWLSVDVVFFRAATVFGFSLEDGVFSFFSTDVSFALSVLLGVTRFLSLGSDDFASEAGPFSTVSSCFSKESDFAAFSPNFFAVSFAFLRRSCSAPSFAAEPGSAFLESAATFIEVGFFSSDSVALFLSACFAFISDGFNGLGAALSSFVSAGFFAGAALFLGGAGAAFASVAFFGATTGFSSASSCFFAVFGAAFGEAADFVVDFGTVPSVFAFVTSSFSSFFGAATLAASFLSTTEAFFSLAVEGTEGLVTGGLVAVGVGFLTAGVDFGAASLASLALARGSFAAVVAASFLGTFLGSLGSLGTGFFASSSASHAAFLAASRRSTRFSSPFRNVAFSTLCRPSGSRRFTEICRNVGFIVKLTIETRNSHNTALIRLQQK